VIAWKFILVVKYHEALFPIGRPAQRSISASISARAIACQCECPENRARWVAMAEHWAALAQIEEATLICGEASVPSV